MKKKLIPKILLALLCLALALTIGLCLRWLGEVRSLSDRSITRARQLESRLMKTEGHRSPPAPEPLRDGGARNQIQSEWSAVRRAIPRGYSYPARLLTTPEKNSEGE